MAEQDEFFVPEDIDKQIERIRQSEEGDQRDAEALAHLRNYYQVDAQQEQEKLDRIWNRIAGAGFFKQDVQESEKEFPMQDMRLPYDSGAMGNAGLSRPKRTSFVQRLGLVAAAIVLVVLVGGMTLVFYTARQPNGGAGSPPSTSSSTSHAPLKITAVDMSVSPSSLQGMACGTNATVTYTALFHANANNTGGTVKFSYTTNNGRAQTPASLVFKAGQTTQTYSFTWSGALPLDHTAPGAGGVQVSSPNQLTSALVAPTGQCGAANFQVTSVNMAVSPSSIQGMACGTNVTVTYTATIHVAANSPGGTVKFSYTTNNGRAQTPTSVVFKAGQTTQTYSFTWSGALPADHTNPGLGGIQVTSPNQLTSTLVAPTGQCTAAATAAFQVTSVDMAVSPASIQGKACGTNVTVTYTATIHVAANSPGGTVQFSYTTNNGRGQTSASLTFSPGQTVRTYSFTWSGALPADHTYPGPGGIMVTSPNQLTSTLVAPTGTCS